MSFRNKNKKKLPCKPNVIPILDAVFIFIFFLLMSAQFLEVYEIGSDAPAIRTVSEERKDKRPPLNLTLVVRKNEIRVETGLEGKLQKAISLKDGNYDLSSLSETLMSIKKGHIEETSVIIKPDSEVEYKKLVFIMDTCRELPQNLPSIIAKNGKGESVETRELFNQIIFETLI